MRFLNLVLAWCSCFLEFLWKNKQSLAYKIANIAVTVIISLRDIANKTNWGLLFTLLLSSENLKVIKNTFPNKSRLPKILKKQSHQLERFQTNNVHIIGGKLLGALSKSFYLRFMFHIIIDKITLYSDVFTSSFWDIFTWKQSNWDS